jgi:ElaB/YqjD/DUF883 family membrane-anchored ribosome-binding protein
LAGVITVLAAGASALQIASPENGQVVDAGDTRIEVTGADGGTYDLWVENSNGNLQLKSGRNDTSGNVTHSFSSYGTGSFSIVANDSSAGTPAATAFSLGVDASGPALDDSETFPSPDESISDERPNIELRFDDSPAGVNGSSVDASFQNSDINLDKTDESDGDGGGATFEPDEDLSSEETYTVDWSADDQVGNTGSGEFDFTVDNSYNGPTGVSLEPEDGRVIGVDDDEFRLDVTVDENDDGDTEIEVGCYEDSDFDNAYDTGTIDDTGDSDEEDRTFTCDIDVGEYNDGDTIYIRLADQAGNRYSDSNDEITASYEIDTRSPLVQSLEFASTDVSDPTFPGDFDVSVEVDDDTESTSRVEYYFDSDTDNGDGTALEWDGDGDYTVDTSDLESGSHTLHIRARDSVDDDNGDAFHGYSDAETLDFSLNPDASRSIDLRATDNVAVTAGESGTLNATVANTGGVFVSEFNVSVSGFFSGQGTVEQLRSGAEGELDFGFDTSESDLGSASVTLEADGFDASKDVAIDIEANQEQRSNVESKLQRYGNELESLRSNYTELRSKVSGTRESNLSSRFNEYESLVQETRSAVESDNYAEAQELLSNAQTRLEASKESVSNTESFVESRNQRNAIILAVVGLLAVVGVGVGGFIYSERYGLDIRQALDSDIPTTSIDGIKSRIRTVFTDEEDADEFEWSGFED